MPPHIPLSYLEDSANIKSLMRIGTGKHTFQMHHPWYNTRVMDISGISERFRKRDLPVILCLGAAVALFFWPAWILNYRYPVGGGDIWGQLHPIWSYISNWLRRGVVPLWSTQLSAGDPIFSEPQYGLGNPLNWWLFLSHPITPWMITLRSALSLWLAGSGLYVYLRHSPVWKINRLGAFVGAVTYMFSDPFVAHLGHPQFNDTLAWLPWALLGIDYAMRRRGNIALAATALAALWVSGHAQAALYATGLIVAYIIWQLAISERPRRLKRLGHVSLTFLLAVCLAAPVLLPAVERYPYTDRAVMPPKAGEYEFHLGMWRDFISPLYHGRNMRTFWAPWDRVESGAVGVAALALAAFGLLITGKRRTLFLWFIAIVTVLYALGTKGPIYPHLADLPIISGMWKTGRAIFLVSFVLAIAAAQGTQLLEQRRFRLPWLLFTATGAILIAVSANVWAGLTPSDVTYERALSGLQLAAGVLGAAGLLGSGILPRSLSRAGLSLLVLAELIAAGSMADAEPMPDSGIDPRAAAIAYLQADDGWFRVDVDGAARGLWSPASLMTEGFEVPQGTGNPMELVVYNQFYWGIPHKGHPTYRLLGAKYIIVPKGAQPGGEGIWPIFLEDPSIDIHLNTNALTRVWLVYVVDPVDNLEEALAYVRSPDFSPETTAAVLHGPALASEGAGRIEAAYYGPNRAEFRVSTTAPALLILSDLQYPGWRARVDGIRETVYTANGIFRGVYVPAGDSYVSMIYRPPSLQLGLGLLGCGMLGIAAILGHDHLRERRENTHATHKVKRKQDGLAIR